MNAWTRLSSWFSGRSPVDQNSLRPQAVQFIQPRGSISTRPDLVPAYQSCVSAISQSLAKVPLRLARVESRDSYPISITDMIENPLYAILMYQPNPYQTSFQFRETLAINAIQDGNAYAYIERRGNDVVALHPVNPRDISEVWLFPQTQQLFYRVNETGLPFAKTRGNDVLIIDQADMIHITYSPSYSRCWRGVSAQENMLATLDLAAAQQNAAYSYLYNGGGALLVGNFDNSIITEEQRKQWVSNIKSVLSQQGPGGQIVVSDAACKLERIEGLKPDDQQFIESRKMTSQDICMYLGVPAAIIGLDTNLKYNTYAQQWQSFRSWTLDTWAKRFEEAFESKLIPLDQRDGVKIIHDFEELWRNDPEFTLKWANTVASFQIATINEIRLRLNLPPLPGDQGSRLALPAGAKQMQEATNAD